MKKLIVIFNLVIMFFASNLFSQQQNLIGNSYITVADMIEVHGIDVNGNIDNNVTFRVRIGTKFRVNGFDSANNLKITFWYFDTKPTASSAQKATNNYGRTTNYVIEAWADGLEFTIDPKLVDNSCKHFYGKSNSFTWGIMTLPIKARFGNSDGRLFTFEENLNLGFTCGFRHQFASTTLQAINILAGFGVGSTKIDSSGMKNTLLTPSSRSALSLNLLNIGVLYQFDIFQIGFFMGGDYIPTEIGRNWKYQGKPWLGMAIGVSLFSKNKTDSKDGKN